MQSRAFAASLITIVSGVAVDIAHAQWTVTQLGPTDPPTESTVNAVSGGQQAGGAAVGLWAHASLWSGTAASWVDLHAFVPDEFTSSYARGISSDGVNTYVVGFGTSSR